MDLENLRFPIGRASIPKEITQKDLARWIDTIEKFPQKLDQLTTSLNREQLDTPYRKNGWTVRQVVHHCYDSHHNSYTRFKWALTEDSPIIKAYFEAHWATLQDSKSAPISLSINGLIALHAKWVYLLKRLSRTDFEKYFIHPANNEKVTLKENTGIYAWHCRHHYAHIEKLLIRKNWV
ncbi:putative metal-dependent hydrolase [Polaribacter sp.]|nr:putative metal-dependent hydrolase [Polaribacter sp.]